LHVPAVSALWLGARGVASGGEPINFYLSVAKGVRNSILIMSNSGSLFPALCTPGIRDRCPSGSSGRAWKRVWSGGVLGAWWVSMSLSSWIPPTAVGPSKVTNGALPLCVLG